MLAYKRRVLTSVRPYWAECPAATSWGYGGAVLNTAPDDTMPNLTRAAELLNGAVDALRVGGAPQRRAVAIWLAEVSELLRPFVVPCEPPAAIIDPVAQLEDAAWRVSQVQNGTIWRWKLDLCLAWRQIEAVRMIVR